MTYAPSLARRTRRERRRTASRTHPATLPVLGFGAVLLALVGFMGWQDNREGHAWCDGAALALHRPVGQCMAAWNSAGASGVRKWANAALDADGYVSGIAPPR